MYLVQLEPELPSQQQNSNWNFYPVVPKQCHWPRLTSPSFREGCSFWWSKSAEYPRNDSCHELRQWRQWYLIHPHNEPRWGQCQGLKILKDTTAPTETTLKYILDPLTYQGTSTCDDSIDGQGHSKVERVWSCFRASDNPAIRIRIDVRNTRISKWLAFQRFVIEPLRQLGHRRLQCPNNLNSLMMTLLKTKIKIALPEKETQGSEIGPNWHPPSWLHTSINLSSTISLLVKESSKDKR